MFFRSTKKKPPKKSWQLAEDDSDKDNENDIDPESYQNMLSELADQEKKEQVEADKAAAIKAKEEAEKAKKEAEEYRKREKEEQERRTKEEKEAKRKEEEVRKEFEKNLKELRAKPNPAVFLDIEAEGENNPLAPAASLKPFRGRLVFELFRDVCPMTTENFRKLCTGEVSSELCFKGNEFHRIIPGFMAQAGDITHGDGTGGMSIYGPNFPDENFYHKHKWPGMLSMANSGPDSNGSQFYITLKKCSWLDGKHVVFGQIKDGISTLQKIGKAGTKGQGEPKQKIVIVGCGEIDRDAVESLRNEDRKKARRLAREGVRTSPIRKSERWNPAGPGNGNQDNNKYERRERQGRSRSRDRKKSNDRRRSGRGGEEGRSREMRGSREIRRSRSRDKRNSRSRDGRKSRSRERRRSRGRNRSRSRSRGRRRRRSDSR